MSDIAINPVTRRVQFTGNTGTGPFAFTFNVLNSGDIEVYKNTTLLTLTSDYTVSIAANGTGSVTLQAGQAVVSADYLTIIGGRDLERTTDFVTAGDLLASSLNEQLDSNVIMSQQLDESFGRSVSVSPGDVDVSMTLPVASSRASQILAFTSTGAVTTTNLNDLPELTVDKLNVDNLTLDGNTISTTNTNGNLILTPNGTGDVVVSGDLVVNGTTTTIHSTVVDIADKNITIAYGSADAAAANGAGITVAGADATMNYYSTPDGWEFNKAVTVGYTGGTPQDLGGVLNVYSSSSSVPGMVIKSSSTSVDPKIQFEYSSQIWTVGQDSSSDDFKIINGTNLNSSAEIHINTDGDVALGGVSHYSNYELSVPQRVAIRSGSAVAGIDFASPTELVFDGNVGGTNGSFSKFRFVSSEADKMVLDGSTLKVNALAKVSGSEVSISDNLKFGDDKKAVFGDSTDLSVYFDASANKSYISHTGSGSFPTLEFNTDGYDMRFVGGGYFMIRATPGADVKLMHAGSTKLETSASGVVITGSITADSYNLPGVLSLADGSNSAPSLTNTGDTNTGLYFPAADQVGLTVAGTQRLNVSATGIDVTGTVLADGLTVDQTSGYARLQDLNSTVTDGTNMGGIEWRTADSNVVGANRITARVRVEGSGTFNGADVAPSRMIFSTHAASGANPVDRMKIDYNGDINFYATNGTTQAFHWDAADERLGLGVTDPDSALEVQSSANGFNSVHFANTSSTSYGAKFLGGGNTAARYIADFRDYSNASKVKIDGLGNVGIGTISPATALEISTDGADQLTLNRADASISTNNTLAAIVVTADDPSADKAGAKIGFTAGGNWATDSFPTNIVFSNDAAGTMTPRMTIDSSGNVGIGVTPTQLLTVGNTSTQYTRMQFYAATNGASTIHFGDGTSGADNYRGYLNYDHDSNSMQFATSGSEAMRIDSSGNVLLGTTTEGSVDADNLTISGDNRVGMTIRSANSGSSRIYFSDGTTGAAEYVGYITYDHSDNHMRFGSAADEAFRIDGSRNLLVGTTVSALADATSGSGIALQPDGQLEIARAGTGASDVCARFNRSTGDGAIVEFRKSGATVGSIASVAGGMSIYATGVNNCGWYFTNNSAMLPMKNSALSDNLVDLGNGSYRFDDIFATNGTIQTSDRNEKQDISELSDAEQRVAVAAKGLLRKFRWRDAVAEKGDEARTHFGIIAQDLQAAFSAEGLDAGNYAMFISTTWTDEETGEERTRMGVRYSELLAFIISAI